MKNRNFSTKITKVSSQGFTLIELMVSASILVVIMGTVLFGYGQFNDNLALSAAGQEIAIAVRQAQTYGLTVREVGVGGGKFDSAYGIYFDPNSEQQNYYIFADANTDQNYDVGSGCGSGNTECVEKFTLRNGIKITDICDEIKCPPHPSARMMDVTFLRPNPDAVIYFTNNGGNNVTGPTLTGKVVLTSPKNKTLTVTIESTGQVLTQ